MNDTVVISEILWHRLCYELEFDDGNRKGQFEECFNCTVTWRSRLHEWDGNKETRPDPVMILKFINPTDATIFALKWAR